jgi:hypothetical protein
MSAKPARVLPWGVLSLFALILVTRVGADDLLDQAKRQNQVEAQRVEAEVNKALAEARRLEVSNPDTALKLLRGARALLEDVRGMADEQRQDLQRRVDARIRAVQASLRQQRDADDRAATVAADKERQTERPGPGVKQKPADQARDFINRGRDQDNTAAAIKKKREEGVLAVGRDLDRASVPPSRDVEFPAYWAKLSKLPTRQVGPKLTEKEKDLIRALSSTLSVDFDKEGFRNVINYLAEKTGTTIFLDKESLREKEVEYDDPVSFSAKKVTYRTILRKILADKGLTYILRDGMIEVVTQQKAREAMVTRTYPISDFLPVPDPRFGPFLNRVQMVQAATQIINLIQTSVEPSSWQVNGGPGSIMFHEPSMSLIIRNSAEMHYSLASPLGR